MKCTYWGNKEYTEVFAVSEQVQHNLDCAATDDGYSLGISDFGRRGIVLSM